MCLLSVMISLDGESEIRIFVWAIDYDSVYPSAPETPLSAPRIRSGLCVQNLG